MSIEFACTGCQKILRVSDESAGKDARCPDCQSINRVPFSSSAPSTAAGGPANSDWAFSEVGAKPASSPFQAASANPYASPQATVYPTTYGDAGGPIQPTVVDIGVILNYAFGIWQQNLGLLLGVTVAIGAASWVVALLIGLAQMALKQNNAHEFAAVFGVIANLGTNAFQIFLGIGQAQIVLKLARRQRAEFTDLFAGGPRFLPVLVASILGGIAALLGFLLMIVPGVILCLMYWPFYYLLVEGKTRVMESFSTAATITKGNWGTTFLIWLLSLGIMLLGFLALCIGLLFAAPLVSVIWATGYLMMSGQIVPYPQQASPYPTYLK